MLSQSHASDPVNNLCLSGDSNFGSHCTELIEDDAPAALYDVQPVILSLSLAITQSVEVRGSTSAQGGYAEAYSQGVWKPFANVDSAGQFENLNLPRSYLDGQRIRVRIRNAQISLTVVADNFFPHSRSLSIPHTRGAKADADYYQWRLQWADYQPTGYSLPAQTEASVWLLGDDEDVTLYIGTQGMAQKLDRSRQTANMRRFVLKRGENILPADETGGVIHIRNVGHGSCQLILDERFQPIPYYIKGHTSEQEWNRMFELTMSIDPRSELQLVGDRVVICAYLDTYRHHRKGTAEDLVHSHEETLRIEALAAGLDGSSEQHTRSNMWIYAVESRSTFFPHATTGYIGLPHGRTNSMDALVGGRAQHQWVTLHEYGHHFQTRTNGDNALFRENTVNIYALAVMRHYDNEYTPVFPKRWEALSAWLQRPMGTNNYQESPDTQAIFEQLRIGLGNHTLTAWDRYTREYTSAPYDLAAALLSLCQAAQRDLADFYIAWGLIKEADATRVAIKALNLAPAPQNLTSIRPYVAH